MKIFLRIFAFMALLLPVAGLTATITKNLNLYEVLVGAEATANASANDESEYTTFYRSEPIASPTPSATPTPPSFACDYYASTTGTANGSGTTSSPWDLQTALGKTTLIVNGKTLCLKGGTYMGKFISNLSGGGVVRSAPGEWAKIDGYLTTQLNGAINSSQTTLTLASTQNVVDGSVLSIDTEHVLVTSTVSGNTRSVMRGWNGTTAAAHSSGAAITHVGNQLTINGDNTTYRDLEITSSLPQRDLTPPGLDDQGCCGFYSKIRGAGVVVTNRSGNSLINLIVHDNLDGIFTGSSSSNTLVYGCLTYNNGGHWTNPIEGERGAGNGMYLENSAGYSKVYDVISINNFGHGGQFFGVTGPYVGGDTQGSVFANAGSPMRGIDPGVAYRNLLFGADQQVVPTASVTNSHFYHRAGMGYSVNFGYGAGITAGIFTNNYVIGSGTGFEASNVTSLTMTGNKFYSSGSGDIHVISQRLPYIWNNNTYYATTSAQGRFGDSTTHNNLNFSAWKTATGFDLLSTATTSVMPDTVIVRPNTYTAGRANIVVYAPSGAASINVNLSTAGLTNGQSYTIKNAFNYFGSNVASGTYNSSSPTISLPLTGAAASVATPVGMTYTPQTTLPQFGAFIVVPTTSAPTNTPTATPTPTNTPTQTNTPTPTPTGPAITGTVAYGNAIGAPSARFVSNVLISGAGSTPVSALTSFPGGTYSVSGFGTGSYTLMPSKAGSREGAINSFDAAMIKGYVAGAIALNPTQRIVADVSGNGVISSFDAGAIISYVTSVDPLGMTGNWIFSPGSRTYASITSNIVAQDYTALLMGDVSGNWTNTGSRPEGSGGPERDVAISAPNMTTEANHEVLIPITIQGATNRGIISYEFDLLYDPLVIVPQPNPVDVEGSVSFGLTAVANADYPGLLKVVVYGTTPIDGDGVLLNLKFTAVGAPGSTSTLIWERIMLNEGDPGASETNGQVEISD